MAKKRMRRPQPNGAKRYRRRVETSAVYRTPSRIAETPSAGTMGSTSAGLALSADRGVHLRPFEDFIPTYRVGGVRKQLYRTAEVIRKNGTVIETTTSPAPGDHIINGLSDKVDAPVRYQRSGKSKSGGKKQRGSVIR